jgi:hypothetical protein
LSASATALNRLKSRTPRERAAELRVAEDEVVRAPERRPDAVYGEHLKPALRAQAGLVRGERRALAAQFGEVGVELGMSDGT